MSMMNRKHLATRYRMIPGLVAGTIYRTGMDDAVRATQYVPQLRYKENGVQESGGLAGPQRSETITVHLYDEQLNGWVVEEHDVLHVVDVASGIDKWLRVESVTRNLLQSRYVCSCMPTVARS